MLHHQQTWTSDPLEHHSFPMDKKYIYYLSNIPCWDSNTLALYGLCVSLFQALGQWHIKKGCTKEVSKGKTRGTGERPHLLLLSECLEQVNVCVAITEVVKSQLN